MMMVASSSQGMGAQNRLRKAFSGWAFSSTTALGPNCFSRACASAVVRPRWLSLAIRGAVVWLIATGCGVWHSITRPGVSAAPGNSSRIAVRNWENRCCLPTKPSVPAALASGTAFGSVVRRDHDDAGACERALIWRVTSNPFIPGNCKSIRTKSGSSSATRRSSMVAVGGGADELQTCSALEEQAKRFQIQWGIVCHHGTNGPGIVPRLLRSRRSLGARAPGFPSAPRGWLPGVTQERSCRGAASPGSVLAVAGFCASGLTLRTCNSRTLSLKSGVDLRSAGVIRKRETALEIPVRAFDPQTLLVFLPRLWTFAGDEQPVSLHDHSYVLRFRLGQVDLEQVLLSVFQDVHRRKPIGVAIPLLARRNRRQWGQLAMRTVRCHCIHSRCTRNTGVDRSLRVFLAGLVPSARKSGFSLFSQVSGSFETRGAFTCGTSGSTNGP